MTTYFNYPSEELQKELKEIANALATSGKGIMYIQKDSKKIENNRKFYIN